MGPVDRANFFTQVDKLQAEDLVSNFDVADSKLKGSDDGIPNSLSEIFEISNANRRLNK
jgi:hypothetical protein